LTQLLLLPVWSPLELEWISSKLEEMGHLVKLDGILDWWIRTHAPELGMEFSFGNQYENSIYSSTDELPGDSE
jgi:hypothetical protein